MKKFVAGFVTGALLFGAMGTFAASGGEKIEVFYNLKDIKFDKVSKMPANKKDQPFTYNGKIYAPIDFIAKNTKKTYKYDSKTKTVWIGKRDEANSVYPGNGIEYFNYQEGYSNCWFKDEYNTVDKVSDNLGNEYDKYIIMGVDAWDDDDLWNLVEYPLNGEYKNFKGKLALTHKYKSIKGNAILEIFADDEKIDTYQIKAGNFPKDINLDIRGVNKISFRLSAEQATEIGLFDAYFVQE